jgi:hypothetical protein
VRARTFALVLSGAVLLSGATAVAQSADDSVAVQLAVARALRPKMKGHVQLESRERWVQGKARRENPAAVQVARELGAEPGHVEDVMTCTPGGVAGYCTLARELDQFVVLNITHISGDSAGVEVTRWMAPDRMKHPVPRPGDLNSWQIGFAVTRTVKGWVAEQGPWYVQF